MILKTPKITWRNQLREKFDFTRGAYTRMLREEMGGIAKKERLKYKLIHYFCVIGFTIRINKYNEKFFTQ